MAGRGSGFPFGALLTFVILLAGAFVLIQIGGVGFDQSPEVNTTQTNETVEVNYAQPVAVSESTDRYTVDFYDNETIYNDGSTLSEGTDYEWNATTGEIDFSNTSATNDGEKVDITYSYVEKTENFQDSEPIIQTVIDAVGGPVVLFPLVTFLSLLFIFFAWYVKRALRPGRSATGR